MGFHNNTYWNIVSGSSLGGLRLQQWWEGIAQMSLTQKPCCGGEWLTASQCCTFRIHLTFAQRLSSTLVTLSQCLTYVILSWRLLEILKWFKKKKMVQECRKFSLYTSWYSDRTFRMYMCWIYIEIHRKQYIHSKRIHIQCFLFLLPLDPGVMDNSLENYS